jgi:hypothetical protein
LGQAESRGVHHDSQGQLVKCGRGQGGRAKEARIHTSCRFFPIMCLCFQSFVVLGKLERQGQKNGPHGVCLFPLECCFFGARAIEWKAMRSAVWMALSRLQCPCRSSSARRRPQHHRPLAIRTSEACGSASLAGTAGSGLRCARWRRPILSHFQGAVVRTVGVRRWRLASDDSRPDLQSSNPRGPDASQGSFLRNRFRRNL